MKFALLMLGLLVGCSTQVEQQPSCDQDAATAAWLAAIPPSCFAHLGKEFLAGTLACEPGEADTCALDFGQKQTPADDSGNPVIFLCNCMSTGLYSCLYVGAAQ